MEFLIDRHKNSYRIEERNRNVFAAGNRLNSFTILKIPVISIIIIILIGLGPPTAFTLAAN